jgi:thiamine-phosphate pyrophosphorylase
MTAIDLRFCAILDVERLTGDPADVALAAARGGCTLVEWNGANAATRAEIDVIRRVKARLAGTGVRLVVRGRVDVALAAEADGVHLEQPDMHPTDARWLLGRDRLVGITVHSPSQADELYRLPVDFCWVSPVFPAEPDASPPEAQGLNGLSRVSFRARLASGGLPVGARGGISASNIGQVIGAGADGIAIGFGALSAKEVLDTAAAIRRKVDEALSARTAQRP